MQAESCSCETAPPAPREILRRAIVNGDADSPVPTAVRAPAKTAPAVRAGPHPETRAIGDTTTTANAPAEGVRPQLPLQQPMASDKVKPSTSSEPLREVQPKEKASGMKDAARARKENEESEQVVKRPRIGTDPAYSVAGRKQSFFNPSSPSSSATASGGGKSLR